MQAMFCKFCGCEFRVPLSMTRLAAFCSQACYKDTFWVARIVYMDNGCWLWTGAKVPKGYGVAQRRGFKSTMIHRLVYEKMVGPVPEDLQLDHLCLNRLCVNPDHLEPVTNRENSIRRPFVQNARAATHCKRGHELTLENTYIAPASGSRVCRACITHSQTKYQQRRKSK